MLARWQKAQELCKFAAQLVIARGAKSVTTKLPVTLLEDVQQLGQKGQQVNVSHGYARNFLFPRQQAAPVLHQPLARHQRATKRKAEATVATEEWQPVLTALTSKPVVIKCNVDASGSVTDSIDNEKIAAAVRSQLQVELAPQLVSIPEPYQHLGQQIAELRMILPNGERPTLQILLTTELQAADTLRQIAN